MHVREVVPFLAVKNMEKSVAFYVEGLGFTYKKKWVDEGALRWCQLQLGQASLMLQQFKTEGPDSRWISDNRGEGVELCFFPEDAVAFYRLLRSRGIEVSEPCVSNGMWAMSMVDPDGYRLLFESPAEAVEGAHLSDMA